MLANFFRPRHALIDGNWEFHPQLMRDRFHFLHDVSDHGRYSRIAHHLHDGCASQRADRVQGSIAQNFHPNLMPDAGRHGGAQPRSNQSFGNLPYALGAGAVWLAERDAIAFNMLDHAGRGNLGSKINNGPNDAARWNRRRNNSAWIDPLES